MTANHTDAAGHRLERDDRDARALAVNARARAMFEGRYQGATIRLRTVLHHRPVIRSFTRSFAISMRNWHIATTVPRAALGDAALATQVEAGMLKKVGAALAHFRQRVEHAERAAGLAALDLSLIGHGHSYEEDTPVLGPVAMQVHELFLLCDKFLDLSTALYSFGQISGDEASTNLLEVKRRLQGVITSIRNQRRLALTRVNDSAGPRPAFMAEPDPG